MLDLYYGNGKGKTCVCIGAALRATAKDKKVLYVEFLKSIDDIDKRALELKCSVTVSSAPVNMELIADTAPENKAHVAKVFRELFDSAVITVLTKKFDMLILDGVFDTVEHGFVLESEVYDFLSNAPDNLDVICTGTTLNEKFISLANYATKLDDSKVE